MAYDPATSQLVLFGGVNYSSPPYYFNETWVWSGSTWKQVDDSSDPGCTDTCASSPPARTVATMAYDQTTRTLILFGGQPNGGGLFNDTWSWNGRTWKQVDDTTDPGCTETCTSSPPSRSGASMGYDQATGKVVLFGGLSYSTSPPNLNDTWSWNGKTWKQVDDNFDPGCTTACDDSPPARTVASIAYDQANNQMVLFGGSPAYSLSVFFNDTWVWTGSTWGQVDDSLGPGCTTNCIWSPPGRTGAAMDYDPALAGIVLFGGLSTYPTQFNDTWAWNGMAWIQVADTSDPGCTSTCSFSPPIRSVGPMANDPSTGQLVLFGGQGDLNTNTWLNDTWYIRSGA